MKTCKDCNWFDTPIDWSERFIEQYGGKGSEESFGLCRIKHPVIGVKQHEDQAKIINWGMWPIVGKGDWCGEFQEKE